MGLAEDLAAPEAALRGPVCAVLTLLRGMPPEDRALVEARLADNRYPGAQITRALADNGYRIGPQSIGRHRRGECACRYRTP